MGYGRRTVLLRRVAFVACICALVATAFAVSGSTLEAQSGSVIRVQVGGKTVAVNAEQVSDNADVPATRHQTRNANGEIVDGRYTPRAISLGKLLSVAGVSPKYVELPARGGGSQLVASDYEGTDGPVVFWISGTGVHYFVPLSKDDPEDTGSSFTTPAGTLELDVTGHTGNLLDPSAGVTPASADAGDKVTFDASASGELNGEKLTYEWDFGDGGRGAGSSSPHVYKKAHAWRATVTVTGDKDSMGIAHVDIEIGKAPKPPAKEPDGNAGDHNEQQPRGGSSNPPSPSTPSPPSTPAPTPTPTPSPTPLPAPTKPPKQPEFNPAIPTDVSGLTPVSGVVISDVSAAAPGSATIRTTSRQVLSAVPDTTPTQGSIPLGIAAAVALAGIGAWRERRR
jgi:hypothetical protein